MSAGLSARALAVLGMAAAADGEIAAGLGMSTDAVRTYRSTLVRAGDAARVLLAVHPLAEIFPAMAGPDFAALVEDIRRAGGVREKIVLHERRIVDGRNRFAALIAAGLIENPVTVADLTRWFRHLRPEEGAPLAFVLSANLHRRHLTESQRALVAANLAGISNGGDRRSPEFQSANLQTETPVMTAEAAADALHVSTRSVMTARAVIEAGAPELIEAVRGGAVSLHAAEAIAARPVAEQAAIVELDRAEIMARAKVFRTGDQAEKKARRAEKEAGLAGRIAAGNAALGTDGRKYGVIYADPEWKFKQWSDATGMDRAPDNHYPCSDLADIIARPVASIAADDCALFLWVPASMMPDGLAVLAAWGFTYASQVVWDKERVGLGHWVRTRHELLLIGKRGDIPCPAKGEQWESVQRSPRAAHSEKPEWAYRLIEHYFPTLPKIELNARRARAGWDVWGAEAPCAALDGGA